MRGVVGAFFLSYNAAVTFGDGACNYTGCNGSSTPKVQFCYYLPTWIASCAVQFSASWGSLRDRGAVLSLRVPRVIGEDDSIWVAIEMRDIKYLQRRFSTKRNYPTDVEEGTGRSLLSYAILWEHCDVIKFLLQEGSDVSRTSTTSLSAESRAKENLLLGRADDEAGLLYERIIEMGSDDHISTVIHDSVTGINYFNIEKAIEMEPESLNSLDSTGNNPLHWAARLGDDLALNALLRNNASTAVPNAFHLGTPLHAAASYGSIVAVEQLLDAGSDPNARDAYGQTPLYDALTADNLNPTDIVKLLLRHGGDPNVTDASKHSPLSHYAADLRHVKLHPETVERNVDTLLMAGADMDPVDKWGRTPLLNWFMSYGYHEPHMFRVLHSRGARLDVVDIDNRSVLHHIALRGTLDHIAYLRGLPNLDLDTEREDSDGDTALQCIMWRVRAAAESLWVGMRKSTKKEVCSFRSLIGEIKDRQQRDRILEESLELRRVQTGEDNRSRC